MPVPTNPHVSKALCFMVLWEGGGTFRRGGLGGGNWDIVAIPLRGFWEAVLVIFPIAVSTANKISGQSHLRTEMSV